MTKTAITKLSRTWKYDSDIKKIYLLKTFDLLMHVLPQNDIKFLEMTPYKKRCEFLEIQLRYKKEQLEKNNYLRKSAR